jgi:hypothetical protein
VLDWLLAHRLHDPAWVQAYWTAAVFIVSLVTLFVLAVYAWDTHEMAKASVQQIENAQTPFIALIEVEQAYESSIAVMSGVRKVWAIENQGSGAAVNIEITGTYLAENYEYGLRPVKKESIPTRITKHPKPLGVGATALVTDNKRVFKYILAAEPFTDCVIEYESLSGRMYRTIINNVDGKQKVRFERA